MKMLQQVIVIGWAFIALYGSGQDTVPSPGPTPKRACRIDLPCPDNTITVVRKPLVVFTSPSYLEKARCDFFADIMKLNGFQFVADCSETE